MTQHLNKLVTALPLPRAHLTPEETKRVGMSKHITI